jgi:hypothetical protein
MPRISCENLCARLAHFCFGRARKGEREFEGMMLRRVFCQPNFWPHLAKNLVDSGSRFVKKASSDQRAKRIGVRRQNCQLDLEVRHSERLPVQTSHFVFFWRT